MTPALRGVPFVMAPRRLNEPSGVPMTRSAGLLEAASKSCAHGLLLGSTRSRAARLSLRRSRIPRALRSRLTGARYSVLFE